MAGPAGYMKYFPVFHPTGAARIKSFLTILSNLYDSNPAEASTNVIECFNMILNNGWAGRIRTCACWDQNPVPYRLATAQ